VLNHTQHETYCNTIGGHLASWDSLAEQNEVEQAFIKMVRLACCAVCLHLPLTSYNTPLCGATSYT
jgi:hypothetical protein